jgi:hypothetical protein
MNRLWRDGAAVMALGCAVACAKTQARVPEPVTALAMPAPPPHTLIPVEFDEPVASAEPEPEPVTAAASTPRPRTTPSNPARPPSERPATPPAPSASEPAPAQPVLQTTPNASSLQERIRTQLADAETNLRRLNPNELNVSARAQFDLAQGFIRQAKEAVQIKNFLYAEHLAKKAALVAGQLLKG